MGDISSTSFQLHKVLKGKYFVGKFLLTLSKKNSLKLHKEIFNFSMMYLTKPFSSELYPLATPSLTPARLKLLRQFFYEFTPLNYSLRIQLTFLE